MKNLFLIFVFAVASLHAATSHPAVFRIPVGQFDSDSQIANEDLPEYTTALSADTVTGKPETTIREEVPQMDVLKGKRLGIIGDSYVKNHREPVEHTWHYKFAKKHGMAYFNYGRNGNSIAYSSPRWGEAMYLRYKEMSDSLDYVIVVGGHNDGFKLDSIGGIDIFKEKLAIMCEGLIAKYPTAKIFFFTRWNCKDFKGSDAEKVVDAMIEVCGNYNIPIFDCARKGGIYASNDHFRKIYFQQSKNNTDTAHLNEKGHERFLKVAESFLLQY